MNLAASTIKYSIVRSKAGTGIFGIIGSIALAPATGGASLFYLGATSAFGTIIGNAAIAEAVNRHELNNGKGSTIKLTNEVSESNNKLGERSNKLSDDIKANIEVLIINIDNY